MSHPAEATPLSDADSGIIRRPLAEAPTDQLHTGFIAEQRLADLLFRRKVRRIGPGVVESAGQRFAITEAVSVIARIDALTDNYGLIGAVEGLVELTRAGATFFQRRMQLGNATYAIVRGVIAVASPHQPANDALQLLHRLSPIR